MAISQYNTNHHIDKCVVFRAFQLKPLDAAIRQDYFPYNSHDGHGHRQTKNTQTPPSEQNNLRNYNSNYHYLYIFKAQGSILTPMTRVSQRSSQGPPKSDSFLPWNFIPVVINEATKSLTVEATSIWHRVC